MTRYASRSTLRWCAIALGLALVAAAWHKTTALDPGLRRLAAQFEAANRADSIEPMLALYELTGSDKATISRLKSALLFELGQPIAGIEFEPLSGASEERIDFTYNGIRYGPSLTPRLRMRVRYDCADQLSSLFTIGTRPSGEWQIVSSKPVANASD